MHRPARRSLFAVSSIVIIAGLVGCGSEAADDQSVEGAPPSDARIINASSETKGELGVAKWGFGIDESGDHMTSRAYGDKNEVLATVEQTLDRRDPEKYYLTIKLTGTKGTAQEKIEFATKPSDDGKGSNIYLTVIENSFGQGTDAQKILDRFKSDLEVASSGTVSGGGGSLVGQAHPLDGNGQLVSSCNETTKCQTELIRSEIAAAGASSNCGLLNLVGQPILMCAGAALVAWWTGPGAGAACVGGAATAGVWAGAQCITARRDASEAANTLKQCQQKQQQSCGAGS